MRAENNHTELEATGYAMQRTGHNTETGCAVCGAGCRYPHDTDIEVKLGCEATEAPSSRRVTVEPEGTEAAGVKTELKERLPPKGTVALLLVRVPETVGPAEMTRSSVVVLVSQVAVAGVKVADRWWVPGVEKLWEVMTAGLEGEMGPEKRRVVPSERASEPLGVWAGDCWVVVEAVSWTAVLLVAGLGLAERTVVVLMPPTVTVRVVEAGEKPVLGV